MQLLIDEIFAEKVIPADDSVRLLDEIMEGMDYTELWRAYEHTGRRTATNPVKMYKVVVYANMEGITSSRGIASACSRDINFIWLLDGEKAPNHSEIAKLLILWGQNDRVLHKATKLWEIEDQEMLRENMSDDEVLDEYTCQNGKKLKATHTGKRKSKSGFESEVTYYECESCEGCQYKKSCTRSKGNRKLQVSKRFVKHVRSL